MSIISNALSGANAAQAALNATSQNIANVATKGYTRQGVLLSSVGSSQNAKTAGNGVNVNSLLRFSDSYKNQQLWRAASTQGMYTQTQAYLTQLEQVMADDTSSISTGLDSFFAALNAAAVDPTSTPLRQQIVTSASALAQQINSVASVMNNQLSSVQQQRSAIMPQANTALSGIAELNKLIASANSSGANVSSLIDSRDQLIDGLASQMAVEVVNQPDGTVSVSLKTGQPLVIGSMAGTLTTSMNGAGEQALNLTFANTSFIVDSVAVGGKLGGLGDFERNVLKPLQQSVADIAKNVADIFNTQQAAGTTTAGTAGTPLFTYTVSGTSGTLSLAAGFSAADLAFSSTGAIGDSSNLQAMIALSKQSINVGWIGSVLLSDADTQLVGKLGIASQQNQALMTTADTVRTQAETDWSTTSAVNKDEEAVNLVEFQNMYSANMKVMSVANDLFDATLAMMG